MDGRQLSESLLDYDPLTGAKEWFSEDADGNCFVRYEQDISANLDFNKESQANGDLDKRSDMWHAANIPNLILMEWKNKHGVEFWNKDHADGVKRLLNSDEYRYLRVHNFYI